MKKEKSTPSSPSTQAEAEAGAANLARWKEENPSGGRLSHGAFSKHFRKRYADGRTREGKQLAGIMKGLIDDLGGNDQISASQRLLLDNIQAKLVVIMQISKYVDLQPSIISADGQLLPCLGRGFTTYSEALRRDLECLLSMASQKRGKIPSIEEIIAKSEREGAK